VIAFPPHGHGGVISYYASGSASCGLVLERLRSTFQYAALRQVSKTPYGGATPKFLGGSND